MFKIIKTGILLGLVCFISAVCLAQVYQHTKDKIAAQSRPDVFLKDVFSAAEKFKEENKNNQSYFIAYGKEENIIGYIIPVSTIGYGGEIKLLIGLDTNGKIVNFRVLEHNETPGLGAKITEPKFMSQFTGKIKGEISLTSEDPQNGKIEAITSATISSRAVVNGINEAINFFENELKEYWNF